MITDPLVIRGRSAPSRVLFGPHETNLGVDRNFSDRHVAYYARRAAGGAGILVLEEASVHVSDWPYERAPLADRCQNGWATIATEVRAATPLGRPIVLAGIGHSGGQGTSHWNQRELWAPSGVPEVSTREVPKVMEQSDIEAVIRGFGTATRNAVAAGLDGVEVNAGQFSLVRQFMSGLTNLRNDEFGSDRLLFARQVLAATREAAGEAIVALRLSCDELAPWAGIVPDAAAQIAMQLAPFVDQITVVRGSIFSAALTRPDGHVEPGFNIELARLVRQALRDAKFETAVVAQGSIVDVTQADEAIRSGAADAVEMTRALLADADLVDHARAGQYARIRPCLLCNQTCKVRDNRNPIITCVVDPTTGYESIDQPIVDRSTAGRIRSDQSSSDQHSDIEPASDATSRVDVLRIAGGGVAALEAARVLALAGRSVSVHERRPQFGGAVRSAALGSGRHRLGAIADWLEAECRRLGVQLVADSTVEPDGSIAGTVGRVDLVATGGVPGPIPFTVHHGAIVHDAALVLHDPAVLPDGPIAVWDPIGGPIAVSVAETLAGMGRSVTLITPDLLVGEKLSLSGDLAPVQGRLHAGGVRLVKRALARAVRPDDIEVEDRFTRERSTVPASALVVAHHSVPDTTVDPNETIAHVGDRVAPRTIHEAIREGRRAAQYLLTDRYLADRIGAEPLG
jgi:mycofactocin system FadH/OYE family oxidoreductase 1